MLNGTGAPQGNLGKDGDFYLDTQADVLYGPKANGAWPLNGVSLAGIPGAAGPARPAPHPPHAPGSMTTVSSGRADHAKLAPGWPFCPPCGRARRASRREAFFTARAAGPSWLGD